MIYNRSLSSVSGGKGFAIFHICSNRQPPVSPLNLPRAAPIQCWTCRYYSEGYESVNSKHQARRRRVRVDNVSWTFCNLWIFQMSHHNIANAAIHRGAAVVWCPKFKSTDPTETQFVIWDAYTRNRLFEESSPGCGETEGAATKRIVKARQFLFVFFFLQKASEQVLIPAEVQWQRPVDLRRGLLPTRVFLQGTTISHHTERGATIQTGVKRNCEYRPVDRSAVLSPWYYAS